MGTAQTFSASFMLILFIGSLAAVTLWRVRRGSRDQSGKGNVRGWKHILSPTPGDGLRLLDTLRLTSRASVHVVQWDGRKWLLSCTDERVTTLADHARAETE